MIRNLRKSARFPLNQINTEDTSSPGNVPGDKEKKVKMSIVQHICNKCEKPFTTSVGLKRHVKFCKDKTADISLTIPDNSKTNGSISENHNDLNSKNLNLVSDQATGNGQGSEDPKITRKSSNPYEFEEELSDHTPEVEQKDVNADVCECCGESTATAHRTAIFHCTPCKKSFKHKMSLDIHQTKFHSTHLNAIRCEQCEVSCLNMTVYTQHMQAHANSVKRHKCAYCKTTFSRPYNLTRHLEQTGCDGRAKTSFPCKVCGVEFARKDNLRDHLRLHIGKGITKKIFTCDYCQKEFKGKTMAAIHIRNHTGEKPYKCKECPKAFKSKAALNKHERCHTGEKPHQCNQCAKRFAAKETLNRHMLVHLDEKPYSCAVCGKSFIQCTQLRAHMFYHTGDSSFKCKYCHLLFNRKSKLLTHEKFIHEGASKVKCTVKGCKKSFMKKDDLARHMVTHSEVKPFLCDLCPKRFRTRALLTTHTRTHRREKARSCPLCVRAFIRFDCLLRHLRNRHREKYQEALVEARKAKLEMMKSKLKQMHGNVLNADLVAEQGVDKNDLGGITEEILLQVTEAGDNVQIGTLKSKLRKQSTKKSSATEISSVMIDDSETSQDTLIQIEESEDVEVEIVDIPLSEEYLAASILELLELLIDKENFETFNWSNQNVDDILEGLIIKCGHIPAAPEITERSQRLRENSKLLLTVVIDDSAMKTLFETQTVDEVILNVLRLGRDT